MTHAERAFLPAAGRDWLLPIYDPMTKLLGADGARGELIVQAALQPLHRVLDIGCGTGTMAVQIKTLHPSVQVTALDPDAKALSRARRKALRAGAAIDFDRGFSDRLPYPDGTFDRVLSSMMFHHLDESAKEKTLREVRRVLKPGGRLHLLDFAVAEGGASRLSRLLHSHERLRHNDDRHILGMMNDAGLAAPRKTAERRMLLWGLAYFQASRPV